MFWFCSEFFKLVSTNNRVKLEGAKMSQLVLKSLSILLGIFFIFLGIIKVTGYIDKDLHKDQVRFFMLKIFE